MSESYKIAPLAIKAPRSGMEWHIKRSFLIVRTKLAHPDRFEIAARQRFAPPFDRFAERVRNITGQIGVYNHRPAAEIDRWNIAGHPFEARPGNYRAAIAHFSESPQDLTFDR